MQEADDDAAVREQPRRLIAPAGDEVADGDIAGMPIEEAGRRPDAGAGEGRGIRLPAQDVLDEPPAGGGVDDERVVVEERGCRGHVVVVDPRAGQREAEERMRPMTRRGAADVSSAASWLLMPTV